ncbi:MAG: cation transporter [Clostridiales bacterium]|nr:cation transporter [Clostridiales bacterium]MCD7827280.1 cation transporter [Clostridiales bacterium]
MVKKVKLHDLCCANCAAKIEDKVSKVSGVSSVTVNFLAEKMIMDVEEDKLSEIQASVEKIVHKIEPDVVIEYI